MNIKRAGAKARAATVQSTQIMNKCASCEHWDFFTEEYTASRERQKQRPFGMCTRILDDRDTQKAAVVSVYSKPARTIIRAALVTHMTFGCTEWASNPSLKDGGIDINRILQEYRQL